MKPKCECCGTGDSMSEITNPPIGTYSACFPCMTVGARPPCFKNCKRQGEFLDGGELWCTPCHDEDRIARELERNKLIEQRIKEQEDFIDKRIRDKVDEVLALRGLI